VNSQYADLYLFVGFGPVSNPRYIIAVTIDEPGAGKHYGGDVSAPVFANVLSQALRISGVPPDAQQVREASAPGAAPVQLLAAKDRG
jgi:cell division protein FtsI (penicillin-binding protein 3)